MILDRRLPPRWPRSKIIKTGRGIQLW